MPRGKNFLWFVSLILSLVFLNPSAYSWPFGDKNEKKTKSASAAKQTVVPASQSFQEEEPAEEEGEEAPLVPELPQIPKVPTVKTGIPQLPQAGAGGAEPSVQDPEIVRIKNQIQEIIKINESLKSNYAGQAAEIQKISEQARVHQRILKDLETARGHQQAARPGSETYLNEEKIRLIKKETEKNQKFLDSLQGQEIPKSIKPVPIQEQEARKS
jgi:hypothetical protein